MTTEQRSLADCIEAAGITMDAQEIPSRTDGVSEWHEGASHWRVTLKAGSHTHTVEYSQGAAYRVWKASARMLTAWKGQLPKRPQPGERAPVMPRTTLWVADAMENHTKPEPPEPPLVLACLLSDAEAADMTHEEWCDTFGGDTDSRSGLEMYLKCQQLGRALQAMFRSAEAFAEAQEAAREF